MRLLGLTLLLSWMACNPPARSITGVGEGVTIQVDSPQSSASYPDAATVVISIHNHGPRPHTFIWPSPFRPVPSCVAGLEQRDPVEVWFIGHTIAADMSKTPYRWQWQAAKPPPARIVLQPGQSETVADVTFHPPPGAKWLQGGFCIRLYGYSTTGGPHYSGPRM